MVSSVLVEFVADGDEAPSSTTDCGELGKTISGRDIALGVGEEGMFRMEIKIWHVSLVEGLKLILWGTGESWTPPILIKNAI